MMASGVEILKKNDALKVAQEFMKVNEVDVQDYSLSSYSEQKLGFMGSHLQLTITIKKTNTEEPAKTCKFFVKAVLQDSQVAVEFAQEHDLFTEEFVFFHEMKPLLMKNYKNKAWSPDCYLAKKEFLVLEDLRIKEFKMIQNFEDDTFILKSALETIARFHACSIMAEVRLSQTHKKPVFLNSHFPNNFKEKHFHDDVPPHALIEHCMNIVFAIAQSLGRNSQKIRKVYDKMSEAVKPSKKYCNFICHGDLWANNMMFDDAKPQPHCVLVDFQGLRYAPGVLDVLQFLYINTTLNYRKQYEHELLRFYSGILETTIKNNDETKTAIIPKFEEILEAYHDLRYYGACYASFYLPFILIEQEKLKELLGNSEDCSNPLFADRIDATIEYMKQNESYRKRIEDVVNELADIADS